MEDNYKRIVVNKKIIWLVFEDLRHYEYERLIASHFFLCYFSLEIPLFHAGELILDENRKPMIFCEKEFAELYAIAYVKQKLQL